MKFDKSKILTVVTADQAKVGQKGWFAVLPQYIQEKMSGGQEPSVLSNIDLDSLSPFTIEGGCAWPLFYPAPEPTYAERQAEWVKENGVKEGTRIRITKDYSEDSDARTNGHTGVAGKCGTVNYVGDSFINVDLDSEEFYLLTVPYYAMEIIKGPMYEERQAEWVKENNVRFGTKVRFTKNFTYCEDGSGCCEHKCVKGMGGVVKYIKDDCLTVLVPYFGGWWNVPFTALEVIVIKEPTYRPFNEDELNDLVGEVLTNKKSGRRKLVTGKPTEGSGVNLDGSYINAKNLLSSFYRNTNEPCGIKE
jgi:hypothetical protein